MVESILLNIVGILNKMLKFTYYQFWRNYIDNEFRLSFKKSAQPKILLISPILPYLYETW